MSNKNADFNTSAFSLCVKPKNLIVSKFNTLSIFYVFDQYVPIILSQNVKYNP